MSANWSIRSYGKPYFCMAQDIVAGMTSAGLYAIGIIEITLECRIFALPATNASTAEIHPLLCVHDYFGGTLMELGLTPLGAIVANAKNGASAVSVNGALAPDEQWHTLSCSYDTGTGALIVLLDSRPIASGLDGGGTLEPSPLGVVRMFNGPSGISRTDVAIRAATLGSTDGDARICTYLLDEKAGNVTAGTKDDGDFPDVASFDLTARFMTPVSGPPLWGPVPTEGLGEAYRWMVETEYEEQFAAETVYEEVEIL